MRVPFIAGNWKMFKTKADAAAFAEEFAGLYQGTDVRAAIQEFMNNKKKK